MAVTTLFCVIFVRDWGYASKPVKNSKHVLSLVQRSILNNVNGRAGIIIPIPNWGKHPGKIHQVQKGGTSHGFSQPIFGQIQPFFFLNAQHSDAVLNECA